MKPLKCTLLTTLLSCGTAFGFDLLGHGNKLQTDDKKDERFVAIWQGGEPFEIISTAKELNCQGDLTFDGINIGTVANKQGILAVFAGGGDVGFTLDYEVDGGNWQAMNGKTIPCQREKILRLKATFYRQTDMSMTGTTRVIARNFRLSDHKNTHAISLNAHLNFAKAPAKHTCHLTSAHEQTITLAPIKVQELEQHGKIRGTSSANFHIKCDSATNMVVMVYDNHNSSNFNTTILSPSHDSTGAGVGIELYHNNQPIILHPKPTGTPLFFDGALNVNNGHLSIGAGYVKTGDINAGTIKAKAGLVFFYP